MLDYFTSTD